MRFKLAVVLVAACLTVSAANGTDQSSNAEWVAQRMLDAIGGRTVWAALTGTVNTSRQYRLTEPTVVTATITMDFRQPRFRIETTAPGLHLIRVVDGSGGWRLNRSGNVEPLPADTLAADLRWYAGHVYRTIHRIAASDQALRLEVAEQGRLEVYEGSARVAWFALDARGEPYAFGAHDDDVGSITGPWDVVRDGVHHPAWVARPDGAWRAAVEALEMNPQFDERLFERMGQ